MSRVKGNVGEREVAKLIGTWWQQVEPDAQFIRTPLSGGWQGGNQRHGADIRHSFRASGDLMTTAELFPFAIEVKRRERWSWDEFVAGRRSSVWLWWLQAQTQAEELDVEPMLWFRQNRQPWSVMLSELYIISQPRLKTVSARLRVHVAWTRKALVGRGCGRHPLVVLASDLLDIDPELFTATRTVARATGTP